MAQRIFAGGRLLIIVGVAALAAFALGGFALALLLGEAPFIEATPENVVLSLNANLLVLVLLALLIAYRVAQLFRQRRRLGGGGARLHARVAVLFGLVATAPSIMLVIFSIAFLHVGLEQWFGQKVDAAVGRSVSIARAYLRDNRLSLVRDAYAIGEVLRQVDVQRQMATKGIDGALEQMAERRGFAEIVVFDETGDVKAKAGDISILKEALVPNWALRSARTGREAVLIAGAGDRLRTLLWVEDPALYLLIARSIDPGVLRHVEGVEAAVGDYRAAIDTRTTIEARLSVLYLMFGLVFILASIWAGLMFANAIASPISNLIRTADMVRAGDLSSRAPLTGRDDEIGNLLVGFNRMTEQLQSQQDELISANAAMDERRRFISAVLSGVTSGVVGLDENGVIQAANRYAEAALDVEEGGLIGRSLEEALPELHEALSAGRVADTEVRVVRNGRQRVLLARTSTGAAVDMDGTVVTFTDITDLLAAKRQAAWSGVARRVAHEIKNPLTPIQLAAERLKRKYLKTIEQDPDIFALCCDTIVRQVAALRGMVDEFSEFARLPAPKMQPSGAKALAEEVVFLLRMEHPEITFEIVDDGAPAVIDCDPGQIARALTNVTINGVHAVEAAAAGATGPFKGLIRITITEAEGFVTLAIEDNGVGFPEDLLENAAEPYVTTKEDGSGLGLAIVQRILEEHGGALATSNRPEGGARVEFRLPAHSVAALEEA